MKVNKSILGIVFGLLISHMGLAQLSGPTTVYTGVNNSYTYSGFAVFPTWQVSSNATIVSTSTIGGGYQATIKFNSGTSGWVKFKDKTIELGNINTTVICIGQPTPFGATREEPGVVSLTSTIGTGGTNNKWYSAQTGGTLLSTSQGYSPNVSVTTTFWVTSFNGSCESSPRLAVTATVKPKPVIQSTTPYLIMGTPATLSVSNNTYNTYSWKRNGVVIGTSSTVETSLPGIYTVTVTKTGMTGSGTSQEFILERSIDSQPAKNMVISNQVVKDGVTTLDDVESLPAGERQRIVTYHGGLGNTLQTVVSQGSPFQKDIIQPFNYDEHGRQLTTYMPYISTTNDSKFRPEALDDNGYTNSEQYEFYQASGQKRAIDTKPYGTVEIEPSPLGRMKSQTGPGDDWYANGKKNSVEYLLNRSTDNIKLWKVNGSGIPESTSNYANYQLQVTVNTGENGNKVKIYTDKLGRRVRKDVEKTTGQWMVTSYVYNDFGQLSFIISPKGMENLPNPIDDNFLKQWVFCYKYDELGRMVEYRAPGADWQYTVYDKLDRPVLKQDAKLRTTASWAFIKYDRNGRAVLTGIKAISGSSRTSVQSNVNSQTYMFEISENSATGYTLNRTYPTVAEADLLTVSYYDNYNFLSYTGWDAESHSFSLVQEQGHTTYSTRVIGLPTGGKVRMVGPGTTTWLNAVQYYDNRYRPIQMLSENQLSGLDRTTLKYNDLKQVIETKSVHNGNETVTVVRKVEYDHAGRIEKIFQNINSAITDQLVAQYEYNELGQLVDKKLHDAGSGEFVQSVDYRYTIRGWLSSINNAQLEDDSDLNDEDNDYFGIELLYNTTESGLNNGKELYNGGISAIKYKGPGAEIGTQGQRSYKYEYDLANRLLNSTSQVYTGSTWTGEANALNENMTYDNNGNILSLSRNQRKHQLSGIIPSYISETIDNLSYTYASGSGNRLTKVEDSSGKTEGFTNGSTATTEYTYDNDGSLATDLNKGISSIVYNKLGKPDTITFSDGRSILYTYNAAGIKLTMKLLLNSVHQLTTQYVGGFVYEDDALKFFGSPEGRIVKNGSEFEYQYAITDHQGNTRVVFTANTPEVYDPLATFEGDSNDESDEYDFTGLIVTFPSANHTPGGSKVVKMDQNNRIGAAKSMKVYPGDSVNAEVYAYYESSSGYGTSSPLVSVIMGAVSTAFGGVMGGGESGLIYSGVDNAFAAYGLAGNQGDEVPAAYLNYILFNKNYKLIDMGWEPVTSASNWNKTMVTFDSAIVVKEEGYLFVYLSYENQSNNPVYFDDMKVTHTKSNVIQYNEYYPFGLQTSTSWVRENTHQNAYLYNEGSELNNNIGWYETLFRGYDATLGRFMQVDPMAYLATSSTPYHYAHNNPVLLNDPWGLFTWADVQMLWDNTPDDGFGSWSDGDTPQYYQHGGSGNYYEVGGAGSTYSGGNWWGSEGSYTSSVTGISYEGKSYTLDQLIGNTNSSNDETSDSGLFWNEFNKSDLLEYAKEQCMCTGGALENVAGSIFEKTFHAFMKASGDITYRANTDPFDTSVPGRQAVVPDGIATSQVLLNGELVIVPDGSWYEVKATSSTITASSFGNQAGGLVNALVATNPQLASQGVLFLTFATTHDANLSNQFAMSAKIQTGVNVGQYKAMFRVVDGTPMITFYSTVVSSAFTIKYFSPFRVSVRLGGGN